MKGFSRRIRSSIRTTAVVALMLGGVTTILVTAGAGSPASAASRSGHGNYSAVYKGAPKRGELDCNGLSKAQKPLMHVLCADIRGFSAAHNPNVWGGRFRDNGVYIGHDEPDATYVSSRPGSGNNVNWTMTIGKDPSAGPTVATPGKDVAHWFELSPAPWFSMALCDPNSYPQLNCRPQSDKNAPKCDTLPCPSGQYPGAGSAFMELQFYPPGNSPWVDSESCNNTSWCAALTIDSLECTSNYVTCNTSCEEPVNFAFIQTNGVPISGPSPQDATLQSSIPNADTLMMSPGDKIAVHISDAPVPGALGQRALKVVLKDKTSGKSGFMQASAKNGFEDTSIANCSGTPFNFQPEYNTASYNNIIPWAALHTNISTEFETGHFEPCTSVSTALAPNPYDQYDVGGTYKTCSGPYESGANEGQETSDALCYNAGDTHTNYDDAGGSSPPDLVTGCQENVYQNGDLDFDGSAYRTEWPRGKAPTKSLPGSFWESRPTTAGKSYSEFYLQTDVALSEAICAPKNLSGCTVPPKGSEVSQPNHTSFYPYWSLAKSGGSCYLEFGNVSSGVNTFGKDKQYGTNQFKKLGYPEFIGTLYKNTCSPRAA